MNADTVAKKLAIAKEICNTTTAVVRAFEDFRPPWSYFVAYAVAQVGAAKISLIASQKNMKEETP